MASKNIKEMTAEEALNLCRENSSRLLELRFKIAAHQVKEVRQIRHLKREAARARTHLRSLINKI